MTLDPITSGALSFVAVLILMALNIPIGISMLIVGFSGFGYIVGFVFAGALVGHFAHHAWDRKPMGILVMFLANILIYVPGLIWLWIVLGPMKDETLKLSQVLQWGLYPFIVGDLMKLYLAFLTLPIAWTLVEKIKRNNSIDQDK